MEVFEFQEVSAIDWVSWMKYVFYEIGYLFVLKALEYDALYISLEHRFYGKSLPRDGDNGNADYSLSNLKYLSSQQALADAANFILRNDIEGGGLYKRSKWVVFGCSYSGALSAWFRVKYPNIVVGSVAPSGPVFADLDFTDYYGNLKNYTIDCINLPQ